jgi:MoxR-like ATPase
VKDWKIYTGKGRQTDALQDIPDAPPWRMTERAQKIGAPPAGLNLNAEKKRAKAFRPTESMIRAVNTALYLRRPLLLTGKPGTGKSSLIASVAYELKMGPVLRWPINSRSTVRNGVYEYDAVGRLQAGRDYEPPVEQYLTIGPLGTALLAETWPRALLIDEIDKSDLDFANDLLNIIEEGEYEIAELRRLGQPRSEVRDAEGNLATVTDGRLVCGQFPFVVMTSNGEREFPAALLRRCVRLTIEPPNEADLAEIVEAHLATAIKGSGREALDALITEFVTARSEREVSTDQLLNAVFLTLAVREGMDRTFSDEELAELKQTLFQLPSPVGQ